MRNILPSALLLSTALAFVCSVAAQNADTKATEQPKSEQKQPAEQKKKKQPKLTNSTGGTTPHETFSTVIGPNRSSGNMVTVTYGRPFTKHPRTGDVRKIWGGLVPWDKADRLGADEATLFITQKPILIGDTEIPAGAYTLYIIPSESGTTKLAFSKTIGKWGVPVDETNDLARVPMKKETLEAPVDQLTISVENVPSTSGGVLKIAWESTAFSVPFTVKK